jgi:hypothetical protein
MKYERINSYSLKRFCTENGPRNHWVCGLCPTLRLALSKELNRIGVSFPSLDEWNRTHFRNVVIQLFRISKDGRSPLTQWFWVLYTIVRTPSIPLEKGPLHQPYWWQMIAKFRWNEGWLEKAEVLEGNVLRCNFVDQKSHMDSNAQCWVSCYTN